MKTLVTAIALSFTILAAAAPSQAANYDSNSPEWVKHAFSQIGD